jgi:uncharacterized protein (TIGR03437 family)
MGASSTGCRGPEGPPPQIILNVKANGATGPDHSIQVSDSIPHLLNSCDSIFGPPSGSCYSLITHADGALVNNSNPAKVGEVITAWAVGLGQGSTQVRFQYRLASDDPTALATYFTVGHLILPEWVGPTPGYLGLYQINFKVPSMPAATFQCAGTTQNNALIDITTNFTQAVSLCVQP